MAHPWVPTTEQILNLDGVRQRIDRFRFELCDRNLAPIGELKPDKGATPSVQNDTSNNSSRRLSGLKLTASEAADVNPLTDRLRVYMVLQNDVEFRLGTFLWGDDSRPERSWGIEHNSELVDHAYILGQNSTQAFGWNRGASIVLVMFFLLFRAGFELDDIAAIGSEAERSLAEPISWQPGSTWTQMITDLGNLCGFAAPWFDRNGKLHLDQPRDPAVDSPTITGYEAGTRIVADSITHSDDMLSAANDFAVFDSGTDRLRAGRFQVPAAAPHSFANRGFRIGATESVQGLASQAQADAASRNLARETAAYEWLTFTSTADPRHDTHDIVDALGKRWLETSWSLELKSGGLMQHTMKRVSYATV